MTDVEEACGQPNYFNVFSIVYGVISIILGLLFCFFGYRVLHFSLFLGGLIFAGGITYFVIESHDTSNISDWELLLIGLAVGVVCGLIVMFVFKIGFFLVGVLAGAFVGTAILSLREGGLVQGDVSAWAIIGTFGLVGGVLTILPIIEKSILIITTSFIGAFGVTAAIDFYVNCKAFSGILQQMISDGDFDPLTITAGLSTWLLFGGTMVLMILGIVTQIFFTASKHRFKPLINCCTGGRKDDGYESL